MLLVSSIRHPITFDVNSVPFTIVFPFISNFAVGFLLFIPTFPFSVIIK